MARCGCHSVSRVADSAAVAVPRMAHEQWLSVNLSSASTRAGPAGRPAGSVATAMGAFFICAGKETRVRAMSAARAVAERLFPKRCGGQVLARQPALARDQHSEMSGLPACLGRSRGYPASSSEGQFRIAVADGVLLSVGVGAERGLAPEARRSTRL